ncbi:MAG TPA: CheR family methyltransferase [Polyangia bacterium]
MANGNQKAGNASPKSTRNGRAGLSPAEERLTIVGIGASAGGLEAVGALLKQLELDHTAFVVVQHLAPERESMLGELLSRATEKMKVVTITEGMKVEANVIYVIPPNSDLTIVHGVLHLAAPLEARAPHLPIDCFFRSLAADQGEAAVGVILSGTGTDGSLGLKAIKAEGGMTFVQDPATAKYDGMPRSALESGYADVCLSPEALGQELSRLVKQPHFLKEVAGGHEEDQQDQLGKLFGLIRKEFGNDLTCYKHSTIERRVHRRMALHKIERLADYLRYAEKNPSELAVLYKDVLISVTSFFRDPAMFEALKTKVLPRLLESKKPRDPIRIWTAGTSSGEEAYSVAIALLEVLGDRAPNYKIQLFGTDVDRTSIQQARRGVYPENIALDVSPERLHRFFRKLDGTYQVNRAVRDLLVFATQNLTKDAPFSHLDLVTCRNVLIYLQPVLQKKVLRILHYALCPGGFLVLGTSETVGESSDLFGLLDRKNKVYVKKNITSMATFELGLGASPELAAPRAPAPLRDVRPVPTTQQLADRRLLDRYVPPGVLVNEALEILQYRGRTGPYLEPAPGVASLHILKYARPELQIELRSLLHRAKSEKAAVSSAPLPLRDNETSEMRLVTIDVIPVQDAASGAECQLVMFRENAPHETPAPGEGLGADNGHAPPSDSQLRDIERELLTTKEYLQSTVEELETSNEELQSSNEELQSSNEELQSTNEELETSKEELQSSNEELTTVNDELHNRMLELSQSNDDLSNVLSGVDLPIVIVGMDRRIRRFSGKAERVLNLVASDVGRPVSHLVSSIPNADVEKLLEDVVARATVRQQTTTINGKSFLLRLVPYMTSDHSIRGAVLLFDAIDVERPTFEQAFVAAESAGAMLASIKHPLLILDEDLRIIWANASFYETFAFEPQDLAGKGLKTRWPHTRVVELLQQTAETGIPFKNFSTSFELPKKGRRLMKVEGSVIPSQGGQGSPRLILAVFEVKSGRPHEAAAKALEKPTMPPKGKPDPPRGRVVAARPTTRKTKRRTK